MFWCRPFLRRSSVIYWIHATYNYICPQHSLISTAYHLQTGSPMRCTLSIMIVIIWTTTVAIRARSNFSYRPADYSHVVVRTFYETSWSLKADSYSRWSSTSSQKKSKMFIFSCSTPLYWSKFTNPLPTFYWSSALAPKKSSMWLFVQVYFYNGWNTFLKRVLCCCTCATLIWLVCLFRSSHQRALIVGPSKVHITSLC